MEEGELKESDTEEGEMKDSDVEEGEIKEEGEEGEILSDDEVRNYFFADVTIVTLSASTPGKLRAFKISRRLLSSGGCNNVYGQLLSLKHYSIF